MTSIKPPGGPPGVHGTQVPDAPRSPDRTAEPFASRLAETKGAPAASSTGAATSPQAVVADLKAGRLSPQDAVQRLTDLAVQRSGVPAALRPALEARMRELLSSDPLIGDLVRQMGAALSSEP